MNFKPLRSNAPATSILNPSFKYTPAARTDVRETWARHLKKPLIKLTFTDQVTPALVRLLKEAA